MKIERVFDQSSYRIDGHRISHVSLWRRSSGKIFLIAYPLFHVVGKPSPEWYLSEDEFTEVTSPDSVTIRFCELRQPDDEKSQNT